MHGSAKTRQHAFAHSRALQRGSAINWIKRNQACGGSFKFAEKTSAALKEETDSGYIHGSCS
jgi:hypothetical protein